MLFKVVLECFELFFDGVECFLCVCVFFLCCCFIVLKGLDSGFLVFLLRSTDPKSKRS